MLERGQFRCDVNISIRPKGSNIFGNRAEIKNMSSFRFIMYALAFEAKRQAEILESGGTVDQETRLFDEVTGVTLPMRSKEDAPDYRYFPDPDLLEIQIGDEMIRELKDNMPELPDRQLKRITDEFGISENDAVILTKDKAVSEYFSACATMCGDHRRLSNWIIKELFKLLNDSSSTMQECPITPDYFARLVNLISSGDITESIGRKVLEEMFKTGSGPDSIIDEKGLKTISDDTILKALLEDIIAQNPEAVEQIKAGETKPIDFLMGQVMRQTKGKADPKKVRKLIREMIVS
jgi:aspartyl-tRNA(Asn)/glutamyl-tRNA(Gln) amidotransferase subunit B